MLSRLKPIEILLLSVSGIMLALLTAAHLVVVPAMLDSFREFGLIAPPSTQLALSTKGLLLVEVPGLALFCGAAVSFWRGEKRRGSLLIVLCILGTFIAGSLFVASISLPRPAPAATPQAADSPQP